VLLLVTSLFALGPRQRCVSPRSDEPDGTLAGSCFGQVNPDAKSQDNFRQMYRSK
jgi:hypothetical protein